MKLPENVANTLRSADTAGVDLTDRGAVLTFCSGTHEAAWLAELPLSAWVDTMNLVLQPTPGGEKPRSKKKQDPVTEIAVDPSLANALSKPEEIVAPDVVSDDVLTQLPGKKVDPKTE